MPIPDLANLPGVSRPGGGGGGGVTIPYDFQFEVTGAVTVKADAAEGGGRTFRIKWPNGTTNTYSGNNASITAPDATAGIVSINNEELDTTYANEFAVVSGQTNVSKVISWGQNPWNKLDTAFKDCTNLTTFGTTSLKTDSVGDLDFMFEGCTGLTEANLSSWNNTLGFRGQAMFKDCTNISQVTWNGVVKLVQTISGMFNNVGSNVAAGCNFQTNNLDFRTSTTVTIGNTDPSGGGMFTNALIDADSSNISNWDFRTSIANVNMFHAFRNARVVGDDKTLNISNWKVDCTNLIQYTLMFDQFNEDPGNVRTDHNIALNMTDWQFGSGTTKVSLTQAFRLANFRKIIGLNTWTSGVISRVDYAFQMPLFWAIQQGDNFNDTFWENSAIENGFLQMFTQHGFNLAESDWGESPNIKGLSKSPTTTGNSSVAQMFNQARYTTTLYFDNVDIATGYGAANGTSINYHIHNIKIKKDGAVSGGVDYSNANIKFVGGSFANWASAEISFLTFGSGIDFTLMTNWTLAFNSSFPDWPLTFATNLNLTNLTTIGLSRTLTPCQADNFIRAVHDTTFAIGAPTPFSFSLASSQITNSPSVVNTKLLALAAAGYSITDGNPGTTMPFVYTAPFQTGNNITPTINTSGGKFSSSNVTVNEDTGVFNSSTAVNATIRYTLADGCYNEQVLNVVVPFSPFKFRATGPITIKAQPAVAGSFTIDWGDGSTPISTTGGTSIASNFTTAGTYDVKINASGDATYCDEFAIVSGQTNVTKVLDWGEKPWSAMQNAFINCSNLSDISETVFIADTGCNMSQMLNNCDGLTVAKINNWNLSAGISAYEGLIRNCDNLEELDATNLVIKLSSTSAGRTMFGNNGNSVTNGCLFKMSGMDFSSTTVDLSGTNGTINMFASSKFADGSNLSNWNFPATWNGAGFFNSSKIVGTNPVLNISNWDNYPGTSLSFSGSNSGLGSNGAKINLTNLNLSNFNNMQQMFYFSGISQIIGVSTWNATAGNVNAYRAFWGSNYLSVTSTDNFSNAFIQSLTPTNVTQMFSSFGNDNENVAVNLNGLDLSNVTSFVNFMSGARFSTAPDFSNVTFPSTAVSWGGAFQGFDLPDAATSIIDFSNTTVKISSLAGTFSGCGVNEIKFGSNVDFSQLTSFNNTFYAPARFNNPQFATTANFGAVTDFTRMFYGNANSRFSNCQTDNFIRILRLTAFSNNGNVPLNNSQITEAPSVVRTLEAELVANGWTITENATDATMPFEYTTPITKGVNQTPTGSFTGGIFSSNNAAIPVNAATGEIDATNTGNVTIRYTITATGCYNEQALVVQAAGIVNNYSMNFDGGSDFVDVTSGEFDFSGNFTVSVWAKWDATGYPTNSTGIIDFNKQSPSNKEIFIGPGLGNNFNNVFIQWDGNGKHYTGLNAGNNQWHNIIVTGTGTNGSIKTYLDGNELTTFSSTSYTVTGGVNVIGKNTAFSGRYFKGFIDEVAVWDTVLTTLQIQGIYNATSTNETKDLTTVSGSNLKYWNRMGD